MHLGSRGKRIGSQGQPQLHETLTGGGGRVVSKEASAPVDAFTPGQTQGRDGQEGPAPAVGSVAKSPFSSRLPQMER